MVAPYVAARLGAGLTADCTELRLGTYIARRDGRRRVFGSILQQIRPALGGNVTATIVSPSNVELGVPQMATVRPGSGPSPCRSPSGPSGARFSRRLRRGVTEPRRWSGAG